MRVGLNLVGIGRRAGGIGRTVRELPGALLAADPGLALTVFTGREGAAELADVAWHDAVRWVRLPVATEGRAQMALQLAGLPALGLARRLDVLHSPANVGPPRVPGLPSVVTVNDLIWLHLGTEWGAPEAVAAMRRLALRSARWATRVIAISAFTRDDLAGQGVDPHRVDVVPLAGGDRPRGAATPAADLRARLDLGPGPLVLAVAQKRPYKNLGAAIRAVAAHADPAVRLVLPGEATAHEAELRALAAALGAADRVRFVDWVDDADLEGLYAAAACVVVPSRYEGFGLPVLEAMARGVPVACSTAAALPEVAGDAALLFDPGDQPALDAALARLLADGALRARLAEAGRARAAAFTWRRCAEGTLASYRRAIT